MQLDFSGVATTIASGTTEYIKVFLPVFYLVGGVLLAFIVMALLLRVFANRKVDLFDDDDDV